MEKILSISLDLAKEVVWGVMIVGTARYLFTRWFASKVERQLGKTLRETIIWTHHKARASKNGHDTRSPLKCNDGQCATL